MTELRHLLDLRNAEFSAGFDPIVAASSSTLPSVQQGALATLSCYALHRPDTANTRTSVTLDTDSDDGWGSDFSENELTPAERTWCLDRFDWEDRRMAGRIGEPPPPPLRMRK